MTSKFQFRFQIQATSNQIGCDAGWRRQSVGQSKVAGRGRSLPIDHLPFRVFNALPQQHDRPEADLAGVARGGGSPGEEQKKRSGRAQRATGRREEKEENVDRGAGKAQSRSVLCGSTATERREDSRDRREARPKEECG